jgi:hypothetical protein
MRLHSEMAIVPALPAVRIRRIPTTISPSSGQGREGPARILLINGSPRNDHTCPGEISKSWRLAEFGRDAGIEVDLLNLSRPSFPWERSRSQLVGRWLAWREVGSSRHLAGHQLRFGSGRRRRTHCARGLPQRRRRGLSSALAGNPGAGLH